MVEFFATLQTMVRRLFPAIALVLALSGFQSPIHAAPQQDDQPFYYTREITQADLDGRSLRELTLMRNTIYARAGNPFRKKWLNDYFSAQPWYKPLAKMDQSKITATDRKNAETIASYEAAITRDDLLKREKIWLHQNTPEAKIELGLISMRLGQWVGDESQERTALQDPTLLDKQLTVAQLSDYSRRDLRLLRNLIYARRGRPFKSALLQQYFGSLDWYKENPVYTDALLTPLDKRNINVIRSVEDSLGGPLTDYQHKKEDGWFAQA